MSQIQVLTEETATLEVKQLLRREGYELISKSNQDTYKKVKKRHSRALCFLSLFFVVIQSHTCLEMK